MAVRVPKKVGDSEQRVGFSVFNPDINLDCLKPFRRHVRCHTSALGQTVVFQGPELGHCHAKNPCIVIKTYEIKYLDQQLVTQLLAWVRYS